MPPVRTFTAAKPVKTERTHEENQERAYIAASRRSDRSLEARVESARRASEIHKRRTGRSLRVTEQDVVNEEMYEEEDDDLPMQYRRLTAHLQTTNADFDRRLAAYLTNHVAMRTALGQAVSDTYTNTNNAYSNVPQFANQMPQQFHQQGVFSSPGPMLPPNMVNRSPQMYRQAPYPTPNGQQAYRPNHGRAASVATSQELHSYPNAVSSHNIPLMDSIKTEDRRSSVSALPNSPVGQPQHSHQVTSPSHVSPSISRNSSSGNLANLKLEAAQQGFFQSGPRSKSPTKHEQLVSPQQNQTLRPSALPMGFSGFNGFNMSGGFDTSAANFNFNPFSTTLPMESQQLLGGAFDPNDPMTAMLMGGDARPQQPFYSYNPNGSSKKSFTSPTSFDGMNQTLAPGVLEQHSMLQSGSYNSSPNGTVDGVITPFTNGGFGSFDAFSDGGFKQQAFSSGQSSGSITPGTDRDWQNLINGNLWDDQTSSQATIV